jgi:hypothetical protein
MGPTELFNGSVVSCLSNADCFPENFGICVLNITSRSIWAQENMCVCAGVRGYAGDRCTGERRYPYFQHLFGVICALAVISTLIFFYGIFLSWNTRRMKFGNAAQTTTVAATFGALAISITFYDEIYCFSTSDRACYDIRHGHTLVQSFVLFFTTVSMLNVSLLWIELADRMKQLSSKGFSNVSKYRGILYVYYLTLGVSVVASQFLGRIEVTIILLIPAFSFVCISYVIGYRKIVPFLKGSDTLKRMVIPFYYSAIGAVSSAIGIVGFSISSIALYFGNNPALATPLFNVYTVLFVLLYAFSLMAVISVLYYCASHLRSKSSSVTTVNSKKISENLKVQTSPQVVGSE